MTNTNAHDTAELVIVANRLPLRRSVDAEGIVSWLPSPGGLVTAIQPMIEQFDRTAAWIGWDGTTGEEPQEPFGDGRITAVPFEMSEEEVRRFYQGSANAALWPLYHDAIRPPLFDAESWEVYTHVNRRYAEATAEWVAPGGVVWIHDYHFQLVPQMLRDLRPDVRIGFFLHIPFPPTELFTQLPWRTEVLRGLLGADLVGFQEPVAARNFGVLTRRFGLATGAMPVLSSGGRRVRVGTYPASIDVDWFARISADPQTAGAAGDLRVQLGSPQRVLLGVDRLDYTKGIDARLEAFRSFVVEHKLRPSDVTMVQVAVPSREDVGAYETERQKIEQLVGEINGDHGEVGAPLVHYLYRSVDQRELVALYRAADVMLVTPFRDGMNLVAKEYVASRVDNDGVLVLSEFAAASRELQAALQVNPHDQPGMVDAISKAVWMPDRERRQRMRRMRRSVGAWTAQDWAEAFLSDLAAQGEGQRTIDGHQRGRDPS